MEQHEEQLKQRKSERAQRQNKLIVKYLAEIESQKTRERKNKKQITSK
ncbi:DUF334 domain-containing protein [Staphylococcus epidermidis]|nr:DUF334 domain-containing protein [Staphylococcus epidermidis]